MSDDADNVENPLFELARDGDAAGLAQSVDSGVSVNLSNENGDTLLMLAAYHGHADAVRALLERGADPNLANGSGQTPLGGVVFKANEEVLNTLLAAGADPTAGQPTAIEVAEMFGRTDLVEKWRK
jgi:uncharacterized protein